MLQVSPGHPLRPAALAPRLVAVLLALPGCAKPPPTEAMLVVQGAEVPGLSSPNKKKGEAFLSPHLGDAFLLMQGWGPRAWQSDHGEPVAREGELLQVKRAPREGFAFVFASDLAERPVPAASWICATSPRPIAMAGVACPELLHRIFIDPEQTVAYGPCNAGPCQVGLVRKGRASWGEVSDLITVHQRRFAGKPWLLATRALHEGKLTGLRLTLLAVEPGLPERLTTSLEEVDGNAHPTMRYLTLRPVFGADTLTLEGTRREVDATTGHETWSKPARRVYRFDGGKIIVEESTP